MGVWTVLAAVVPIVGSLWAGAWFIIEQLALKREQRARLRVQELGAAYRERIQALNLPRLNGMHPYQRVDAAVMAYEAQMLRYYGVEPGGMTFAEFDVQTQMSAPVVHRSELRRQVLITMTAAAGVVFLAIELLLR